MTTVNNVQGALISPWRRCGLCLVDFKSSKDFCRHLRQSHCTKEGGSYVCRYGANNICPSLPLEGVSDMDYENHITRDHAGKHLHAHGRNRSLEYNEASPPPSATDNAPSVVQDQLRWTVYNATVNLPAALNDPNRTKRETDFFTKTWGQDFYEHSHIPKSTYIPDISRKYFEKYKNRISKRYKKYIRSTSNSDSVSGETYLHQLGEKRVDQNCKKFQSHLLTDSQIYQNGESELAELFVAQLNKKAMNYTQACDRWQCTLMSEMLKNLQCAQYLFEDRERNYCCKPLDR
ncbi:vacuolar protein sorting-associated protein 54 [Mytilus galloprovincialis]|uniref:Vacuolar protein sorting-associated protein 54 n=1 Tax=Mytilus galloprovincialis TaxID=29158 RepID=A0A8B6BU59_MYTGA|nr:vacuolar protein sorting-associated protein 54 [Mytilus galloprovincialis]